MSFPSLRSASVCHLTLALVIHPDMKKFFSLSGGCCRQDFKSTVISYMYPCPPVAPFAENPLASDAEF